MLFKIFQPNFFSIILLIILLGGDYITIRSFMSYIKKKRYNELLIFRTKRFAIIFNLIAVSIACNLIYCEYLTPQSKIISEQFKECSLVKAEMEYMEPYFDIIPCSMKVPIIEMSSVTDFIREYSERSKNCTEEEKILLQKEMEDYVYTKRPIIEDMQRSTEERMQLIYIMLYSELIYLILYNWMDIVYIYNKLKAVVLKYRKV
jgi:hypothetical protein